MSDDRTLEAKARVSELCARLVRGAILAGAQAAWPVPHMEEAIKRDLHSLKGLCALIAAEEPARIAHGLEGQLEAVRGAGRFEGDAIERFLSDLDAVQRFADEATVRRPRMTDAGGNDVPSEADSGSDPHGGALGGAPSPGHAANGRALDLSPADSTANELCDARGAPGVAGAPGEQGVTDGSSAPRDVGKPNTGFLRVPIALLDHLMGLVSELVLIRNQFLQSSLIVDTHFHTVSQRLNVVTAGLQAEVMRMRMQPVSTVTLRFQRLVRDTSRELGKLVDLSLEGNETEIDKTIIEAIRDPLTHILRNALDHGIESPEERARLGKRQRGRIVVRSYQDGGQVIVEVEDDGRGIDLARLGRKAVEARLVTPETLARLTPQETADLVFAPGLSTTDKVTDLSGRGVGMDVVKTNIEQLGGVVELTNRPGKGLTTRMRIPLTLAIVPALVVRSGGNHFALPQVKIVELLRLDGASDEQRRVESLEGGPVLRLRGRLLPLVSLADALAPRDSARQGDEARGMGGAPAGGAPAGGDAGEDDGTIVVLTSEDQSLALRVDEVCDSIDIIVKPFVSFLKSMRVFSGATILGDGTLALVLDVAGLCQQCGLDGKRRGEEPADTTPVGGSSRARAHGSNPEFLLCRLDPAEVVAIPLQQVFCLEEFQSSQVEFAASAPVVRYRDGLLPLIPLARALGLSGEFDAAGDFDDLLARPGMNVVVVRRRERSFGLVVEGIEDIHTSRSDIAELVRARPGALGTLLKGSDVHTVVHVERVVDAWLARVLGETLPPDEVDDAPVARVLLVEDSASFRKHVTTALTGARFAVTARKNGREALELLRSAPAGTYDVVLTDLDMPEMNGFDLARGVRAEESWFQRIPIVALTSLCSAKDRATARASGIDEHFEKVEPDRIPTLLAAVLGSRGAHGNDTESVA